MTLPVQRPLLTLLLLAACGGGGKTSDSDGSSSGASASTGAATSESTGQPVTGSAGSTGGSGSDSASTGAPASTGEPETTTVGTTTVGTTTAGTTTAGTTTDSSGGDSSGGEQCVGQAGSCANPGSLCCKGLDCCAGVPVPPGQEFCSNMCPISDRNLKTEFAAIDPADVLRRVVALPLSTWRYRKDEPQVRHLGPMAQDFHAAFGLWNSDTMIFPLDASGVSMAAIQGLHARLVAAEAENEDLRARLERLEQRLAP